MAFWVMFIAPIPGEGNKFWKRGALFTAYSLGKR